MSNAFKDKLKKIRDASAKRSEVHLRVRSDEDLAKSQLTVQAFEFREAIETVIGDFFKNFQAEAPGFALTRGFYEGKYMLAVRCDEELTDPSGHTSRYFSRLIFLLDPHVDERSFSIQAKKTIRNRDLESVSLSGAMGAADQASFATFVEAQFLEFAEGYFGEHSLTKPTGVAT
ncbi:MAG TPA: hypothetical protein VFD43_09245 [Planctomycetota bacterium]|nr:hypothetical protein [Planctomycetota bacterium]